MVRPKMPSTLLSRHCPATDSPANQGTPARASKRSPSSGLPLWHDLGTSGFWPTAAIGAHWSPRPLPPPPAPPVPASTSPCQWLHRIRRHWTTPCPRSCKPWRPSTSIRSGIPVIPNNRAPDPKPWATDWLTRLRGSWPGSWKNMPSGVIVNATESDTRKTRCAGTTCWTPP